MQQGPGEGHPLALTGGEAADQVVGPVGHGEALEQLARPRCRASAGAAPRIRAVNSRFSRAVRRSSRPAFSVSTPVRRRSSSPSACGSRPEHAGRAAIGAQHAVEQPHRGGLAGAVGAEQGEHLARPGVEAEARRAPTPLLKERVSPSVEMTGARPSTSRVSTRAPLGSGYCTPSPRAPTMSSTTATPLGSGGRRRRGGGRRRRRGGGGAVVVVVVDAAGAVVLGAGVRLGGGGRRARASPSRSMKTCVVYMRPSEPQVTPTPM